MAVAVAAYSMTPPIIQNQSSRTIDDFASRLRLTNVQTAANSMTIEWNGATTRLKLLGSSRVTVSAPLTSTTRGIAALSARPADFLGCHSANAQSSATLLNGEPTYPIQRLFVPRAPNSIAMMSSETTIRHQATVQRRAGVMVVPGTAAASGGSRGDHNAAYWSSVGLSLLSVQNAAAAAIGRTRKAEIE